jgi:tryptophan-rich sensory protein
MLHTVWYANETRKTKVAVTSYLLTSNQLRKIVLFVFKYPLEAETLIIVSFCFIIVSLKLFRSVKHHDMK